MLDMELIRREPDRVRQGLRDKNHAVDLVDKLLEIDARWRTNRIELEALQQERNLANDEISKLKKAKQDAGPLIAKMKDVSTRIKQMEEQDAALQAERQGLMLYVPNLPHASVPVGADAAANAVVREWGERRTFAKPALAHWDLGEKLGILDIQRSGKIAGSGFILLRHHGARLQRALINFMLDLHTREHGYTEWLPPYLALRSSMIGTGQLPKFENDMYKVGDEHFLIPTAEVPITNLHREEILAGASLPIQYVAFSACFRKEAGAAGRDTRGIIRVHQFDKVELVKFTAPETSYAELESLLANAETVLQRLEIPYRVLELCTGDMSFASSLTYDIEAWSPGTERWLEVSSCSNFEEFQARRAMIRFRDDKGKVRFVHTLNGSGLALPRTMICLLENHQQEDGSVTIPMALRPYMDGRERIELPK